MTYIKFFKNNKALCFTILTYIILLAFKLSYNAYPFLDDYIQFKGYSLYENPIYDTYIKMGLYSVRPLSGLFDILFYSKFYNNLYIPYFIITVLHFASVILMQSNFKKIGVDFGWCFVIFSLFSPIIIESTYWLGASSRIVPPLFLSQLAVYLITRRNARHKFLYFSAYFFVNLASLGFYEQISLFSLFINVFFCLKLKKYPELVICAFNMLLFAVYYLAFKNAGVYYERCNLGGFNFLYLLNNIKIALNAGLKCTLESLKFSFSAPKSMAVAVLCILFIKVKNTPFCPLKIYVGFAICIICFIPFLLLDNYFITFRSLILFLTGIAMILDALSDIWKIKHPFTALICILMLLGWGNEMTDYKKVYEADRKIINGISDNLTDYQKKSASFTLGIWGAKKCYIPLNVLYGEHILNVTSSDWALTGALRAEFENIKLKYVILTDDKSCDACDVILDVSDINYIKKIK